MHSFCIELYKQTKKELSPNIKFHKVLKHSSLYGNPYFYIESKDNRYWEGEADCAWEAKVNAICKWFDN